MNKQKRNMYEKISSFKEGFSLKQKYNAIAAFYKLLNKLAPETHRTWTLDALMRYIDKVYTVAQQISPESKGLSVCISSDKNDHYEFFNTGLVDKFYDDIYCFGEIESGKTIFKGFWTKSEIQEQLPNEKFEEIEKILDSTCKPMNEVLQRKIYEAELEISKNCIKPTLPPKFDESFFDMYCKVRKSLLTGWKNKKNRNDKKDKDYEEYKRFQAEYEILIEEMCEKGRECPDSSLYIEDYSWRCFHLIIDGSDNLPKHFLQYMLGERYLDGYLKTYDEDEYEIAIKKAMLNHSDRNKICECIYDMLYDAVEYSLKLSKQINLIAPYYYIKSKDNNKIDFMLPLFWEYSEKPNCALLFNKEGKVKTLINMDEVYTDLRLIGRLDAYNWLSE